MGAAVALVIGALAITVGIGILRGSVAPTETVVIDEPAPTATGDTSARLYVHVSGAVTEEGLYLLPAGARVVDAIAAAGGFAEDATQAGINLARPLSDGEQLHVPTVKEVEQAAKTAEDAGGEGGESSADAGGLVNLNTADAAALDTLPRVGPAIAQRILDWRDANGRFTSVEDLLAVPGIGDKMLESLRGLVTV